MLEFRLLTIISSNLSYLSQLITLVFSRGLILLQGSKDSIQQRNPSKAGIQYFCLEKHSNHSIGFPTSTMPF